MELVKQMFEPYAVSDVYADGVGRIDNLGATFRVTYFVWGQADASVRGPLQRIVALKIVRPLVSLIRVNGAFASMLATQPKVGAEAVAEGELVH